MNATKLPPAEFHDELIGHDVPVDDDDAAPGAVHDVGALGLVELILKRPRRLDDLIRLPLEQTRLVPRFLAIALAGFVLYGVAQALVFGAAGQWPRLSAMADWFAGRAGFPLVFAAPVEAAPLRPWLDGSALVLIAAYAFGLIAASGVCLPTLYFYGLLAGVRLSMRDVVLHTLKSKAAAAVALVGILPIYAAFALGAVILPLDPAARTPILWLGLVLPFIAGLWGTWSLYSGFLRLADTLPDACRGNRLCFLRRLVVAWAACYTAVTPLMIFTVWQKLS
jgi:hypothetical protein